MGRTASSAAWLVSKYSRAKGQVARIEIRIKELENRLTFHRHYAKRYESQLLILRESLIKDQIQVDRLSRALEIHEHYTQLDSVPSIRPHESSRFFRYGGFSRMIFQTLRSASKGVLTIDDLQTHLIHLIKPDPTDIPKLRQRLQMRLFALERDGKLKPLDPKGTPGRRWMLAKDWHPANRHNSDKYPARNLHRSQGVYLSAHWLIRTQLDLLSTRCSSAAAQDPRLASKLEGDSAVLSGIWAQHPLSFEIDFGKTSPRRHLYRAKVSRRIVVLLAESHDWMTALELRDAYELRFAGRQRASMRTIEAVLKQLLLEDQVEHRLGRGKDYLEWRLLAAVSESIRTSVR